MVDAVRKLNTLIRRRHTPLFCVAAGSMGAAADGGGASLWYRGGDKYSMLIRDAHCYRDKYIMLIREANNVEETVCLLSPL